MNYPKFSVLMSVYINTKVSQLSQAITSLIDQTLLPSEIVIVIDGPVDSAVISCISEFALSEDGVIEFNVVPLPGNVGLGEALRIGTNYVKNEWIARMDADDVSEIHRFEAQFNFILKHPEVELLGTQLLEFSGNVKNIVGKRKVPCDDSAVREFVKLRSPFNHPTVIMKKKMLESVGGYRTFHGLEDYYLWGRVLANGVEVANLPGFYLFMRVDDGMYSRRGGKKYFNQYRQLRKELYKLGIIKKNHLFLGNFLMFVNAYIPNFARETLYKKNLHR